MHSNDMLSIYFVEAWGDKYIIKIVEENPKDINSAKYLAKKNIQFITNRAYWNSYEKTEEKFAEYFKNMIMHADFNNSNSLVDVCFFVVYNSEILKEFKQEQELLYSKLDYYGYNKNIQLILNKNPKNLEDVVFNLTLAVCVILEQYRRNISYTRNIKDISMESYKLYYEFAINENI